MRATAVGYMGGMTGRWTRRGSEDHVAEDPGVPVQASSSDNGATAAPAPGEGAGLAPADEEMAGQLAADQPVSAGGRLRAAATGLRQRAQAAAAQPGSPPRAAGQPDAEAPGDAPAVQSVPRLLQQAAAWSWRLLLVGLLIYVAFRVASALQLVVLPCFAALLLTALLQPLTARLRRAGLHSLAATWCTILAAVVVLAGVGTLAANRVSADYQRLATEVHNTARKVQISLAGPPFHVNSVRLQQYSNQLVLFLSQHKSVVAGTVVTGGKIVLELLTGLVLTVFITFFLLKDGVRIWSWLMSALRPPARKRADNAGLAAWTALVNYVRGTSIVAAIHAVSIGLALWILGVPLLVPLIILVFVAAFVPLVGILVAGALAILVTLGTRGWPAALILLAVFLLENQVESHLLQPLVVGRIVRLHPLAIILVLAVGGIVAGIPGAIVAVPAAAAISYAWPYLRGAETEPPGEP
jgi:predicted PurR-regulated permease PerM